MNINSISLFRNYKSNQSFNGLWGKTSIKTDLDAVMNIPIHEYSYYYYPFLDESAASIKKVKDETENAAIVIENGKPKYRINDFKLCVPLPFTEKRYKDYMSHNSTGTISPEKMEIFAKMQRHIKDKYSTKDYDMQVSALNSNIAPHLIYTVS